MVIPMSSLEGSNADSPCYVRGFEHHIRQQSTQKKWKEKKDVPHVHLLQGGLELMMVGSTWLPSSSLSEVESELQNPRTKQSELSKKKHNMQNMQNMHNVRSIDNRQQ
jgi:hypothetical protein